MTRKQLAERLSISEPYLSLIYNGHRKPGWDAVQRMRPVCRRTFDWWRGASTTEIQRLFNRISERI